MTLRGEGGERGQGGEPVTPSPRSPAHRVAHAVPLPPGRTPASRSLRRRSRGRAADRLRRCARSSSCWTRRQSWRSGRPGGGWRRRGCPVRRGTAHRPTDRTSLGRLPGADRPDPLGARRGGRRPAAAGAVPAWSASSGRPRCWPGRWTSTPRWPACTAGCGGGGLGQPARGLSTPSISLTGGVRTSPSAVPGGPAPSRAGGSPNCCRRPRCRSGSSPCAATTPRPVPWRCWRPAPEHRVRARRHLGHRDRRPVRRRESGRRWSVRARSGGGRRATSWASSGGDAQHAQGPSPRGSPRRRRRPCRGGRISAPPGTAGCHPIADRATAGSTAVKRPEAMPTSTSRSARRVRPLSEWMWPRAPAAQHLHQFRVRLGHPGAEPEAGRDQLGGVVDPGQVLVEGLAELLQRVLHRGLEQLRLGLRSGCRRSRSRRRRARRSPGCWRSCPRSRRVSAGPLAREPAGSRRDAARTGCWAGLTLPCAESNGRDDDSPSPDEFIILAVRHLDDGAITVDAFIGRSNAARRAPCPETRVNGADVITAHQDLHSEQGALRGEHPGRSRNPVIKVADLAWLEFEKPDLDRAEVFARDFGFGIAVRSESELWLRGTFAGSPCMVIRRGRTSRFIGPAFRAAERADLDRLARHGHVRTGRGRARRRQGGRPARPLRLPGPGRALRRGTAGAARAAAAAAQPRYRSPPYERHPAPAA